MLSEVFINQSWHRSTAVTQYRPDEVITRGAIKNVNDFKWTACIYDFSAFFFLLSQPERNLHLVLIKLFMFIGE